jgi:uncharacterized protein YfdQ (DUF2303 family)
MPTAQAMLTMATNFVARQDNVLKSAVRLQSGGINLVYVDDADKGTVDTMRIFERFCIGIPVFHGGTPWRVTCRLKYRIQAGKVVFFYEMVRPDTTHKAASTEMIEQIRRGLDGKKTANPDEEAVDPIPMLMGGCGAPSA